MTEIMHPDILAEIEAYRQEHGLTETAVSVLLLKDPNLVRNLRDGRELRIKTQRAIRERLQEAPEQTA